jgi:hypothetical protein
MSAVDLSISERKRDDHFFCAADEPGTALGDP